MSLLNPDLSNLEIKIASTLTRESGEVVNYGDANTIKNTTICFAVKANRNDIEFLYDAENNSELAVTPYGLCMQSFARGTGQVFIGVIPFVCKTNGRKGTAFFDNIEKANSVATIEWDDGEGSVGT